MRAVRPRVQGRRRGHGEDRQGGPGALGCEPAAGLRQLHGAGGACAEFCERVNGRVHRESAAVPADRLAAEREMLHPLPGEPYALALGEERLVGDDQTVRFGSVRYSTPPGHAGDPGVVPGRRGGTGHHRPDRHAARPRSPGTGCRFRAARRSATSTTRDHPGGNGPRQPRPRPRTEAEARSWRSATARAGGWPRPPRPAQRGSAPRWPARSNWPPWSAPTTVDAALGLAAIAGRFADGDLASIIDHLAAEREIGEVVIADEAHSAQPGTAGWARLGDEEAATMTLRQPGEDALLTGGEAARIRQVLCRLLERPAWIGGTAARFASARMISPRRPAPGRPALADDGELAIDYAGLLRAARAPGDRPRSAAAARPSSTRSLRRMRLPYLRKAAPDVLATARAQRWEPAEVLRVLLAEEVTGRDAATRRMRRKTAAVPLRQDVLLLESRENPPSPPPPRTPWPPWSGSAGRRTW